MGGIQSLKINQNTNLQDLHNFLQDKGSKSKVYGAKDQEGNITLYLKPKAETLKQKIADKFSSFQASVSGRATERRDIAREGIQSLFNKASHDLPESTLKAVLGSVRDGHALGYDQDQSKAHRAGQLSSVAGKVAEMVSKAAPLKPKEEAEAPPGEEALKKLGLGLDNKAKDIGDQPQVTARGYTAKPVEIDGVRYNPVQHLASGGYGHVFKYQSEDGTKTIAFKVTIPLGKAENDKLFQAAAREIALHKGLAENAPGSVIDFIGAVRLPDGQVGIASEFAPHGDVQGMSRKIDSMIAPDENNIQPGQITRQEANVLKLTMLKDMTEALDSFHSKGDMTHFDFKSGNVLIDEHGKAKIADFGTSFEGRTIDPNKHERIDCPVYKAPEVQYAYDEGESFEKYSKKLVTQVSKEETRRLERDLQELFPRWDNSKDVAESIFSDRKAKIKEDHADTLGSGPSLLLGNAQKADVWGLGSSGVEMFTGAPMLSEVGQFDFERQERLMEFQKDGTGVALAPLVNGQVPDKSLARSTGDDGIDGFLNGILVKDPSLRPTAGDLTDHEIFQRKGVSSPKAYDLLRAISSGDAEEIARQRQGLC